MQKTRTAEFLETVEAVADEVVRRLVYRVTSAGALLFSFEVAARGW
jgi:hypothetical protein